MAAESALGDRLRAQHKFMEHSTAQNPNTPATEAAPEKVISSERIHDGKVVHLRVDTIELPSGNIAKREILEHKGAVCIVPMLPDGKIGLIRQWRSAVQEYLYELPAGGLEEGEAPEECAKRESIEEIGFKIGKLSPLFQCYLAPGYSSEMMWGFLGEELEDVGAQPEEDENIELVAVTLDEALKMVEEGAVRDSKTICGLLALAQKNLKGA
jgi:ADP-ribose pyrophosphatase